MNTDGALVLPPVWIGDNAGSACIWVYPGAYVPRWMSKEIRRREPDTNIRLVTIIAWSGMRDNAERLIKAVSAVEQKAPEKRRRPPFYIRALAAIAAGRIPTSEPLHAR